MKKYCSSVGTVQFLPWYLSIENPFLCVWTEKRNPVHPYILVYINAGEGKEKESPFIRPPVILNNYLAQNCNAPTAEVRNNWGETQKDLESNMKSALKKKVHQGIGRWWWGKMLRIGPGCVFWGQCAYISISYVKSKHHLILITQWTAYPYTGDNDVSQLKKIKSQMKVEQANIFCLD